MGGNRTHMGGKHAKSGNVNLVDVSIEKGATQDVLRVRPKGVNMEKAATVFKAKLRIFRVEND